MANSSTINNSDKLKINHTNLIVTMDALQKNVNASMAKIEKLTEFLNLHTMQRVGEVEKIRLIKARFQERKEQNVIYRDKTKTIGESVQSFEKDIVELSKMIKSIVAQQCSIQQHGDEKFKLIKEQFQELKSKMQKQENELATQLTARDRELETLRDERALLSRDFSELQARYKQLEDDCDNKNLLVYENQSDLQKLRSEIRNFKESEIELEEMVNKLSGDLKKANQELNIAIKQNNDQKEALQILNCKLRSKSQLYNTNLHFNKNGPEKSSMDIEFDKLKGNLNYQNNKYDENKHHQFNRKRKSTYSESCSSKMHSYESDIESNFSKSASQLGNILSSARTKKSLNSVLSESKFLKEIDQNASNSRRSSTNCSSKVQLNKSDNESNLLKSASSLHSVFLNPNYIQLDSPMRRWAQPASINSMSSRRSFSIVNKIDHTPITKYMNKSSMSENVTPIRQGTLPDSDDDSD